MIMGGGEERGRDNWNTGAYCIHYLSFIHFYEKYLLIIYSGVLIFCGAEELVLALKVVIGWNSSTKS